MPPEPNQNIEAQLNAYARKRREQTGGPFEMHPATRTMLQAEAARLAPKRKDQPGHWRVYLDLLRPRLALVSSMLAVLAVLAVITLIAIKPAHKPGESFQLAKNNEASRAFPAERDARQKSEKETAPTPPASSEAKAKSEAMVVSAAPAPANPAVDESRDPFGRSPTRPITLDTDRSALADGLARKESADGVRGGAGRAEAARGPAPSLGEASRRRYGLTAVQPGPQPLNAPQLDASAPVLAIQPAQLPAAAPAQASANLAYFRTDPTTNPQTNLLRQRFVQTQASTPVRSNLRNQTPGLEKVLNNFEVEQTGGRIRFIDADGSAYEGLLARQPAEAGRATTASKPAGQVRPEARLRGAELLQKADPARSVPPQELGLQNYSFRVAGTNRSLNQSVVVNGNLLVPAYELAVLPSTPAPANAVTAAGLRPQSGALGPPPLNQAYGNSVIQGKALIGGSNEIPIHAVQVGR